jgi:flagellar biosynthesis protein FlhG
MADQAERLREIVKVNKTNQTRVIAITSGKGGVGKTNFAVNLGIALAGMGSRVTLIDADLGLANVDVILGMIPQFNLGHVILGEKQISDVIINGPSGLKVVTSGSGLYKLANLSDKNLERCLEYLNEIEKSTDIMLIDTGAGLSRNVLKFVMAAGEVIIVTTPEPTALTDAYGVIKVIASADKKTPIWIVVNMIRTESEGNQSMDRLNTVSKRFLDVELAKIGYIPLDPIVSKAVKEQQPFIIGHPKSLAAQSINQIAGNLLNGGSVSPDNNLSFFERLVSKLRLVE